MSFRSDKLALFIDGANIYATVKARGGAHRPSGAVLKRKENASTVCFEICVGPKISYCKRDDKAK